MRSKGNNVVLFSWIFPWNFFFSFLSLQQSKIVLTSYAGSKT
ncbi:integrase [Leptospira weilii serovar Heyan]|nr:integrase [Leptospira weilii serovar Heyan]QDK24292.1 integrase [Leptospira weilii]QDK28253.1 integrase [Leptospira weilii]